MYTADPRMKFIPATRGQIVAIIQSINHAQVGVPGHGSQTGQGTIVGIRCSRGTFSVFVHLYLLESKAPVVYVNSRQGVDIDSYPQLESEAIEFLESMGFMLDNLNYTNLSPLQQEDLLTSLPCFDSRHARSEGAGKKSEQDQGKKEPIISGMDLGFEDFFEEELEELEPIGVVPNADGKDSSGISSDKAARIGRMLASF